MADEVIGGYRLLKVMFTGRYSQVWEVVEASSHRHFAMKLLLPEKEKVAEFRRELAHEATVGKKLAHPNVIRIVHIGVKEKPPNLVMEFFPAGSLGQRLIRKQHDFVKERIHGILKQAATGLAFM
jgi:serine/threonine protein kinase